MAKTKASIVGEPSLLPATFAFGRKKASPNASIKNLAEGFVVAGKKSLIGSDLKHCCQGSSNSSIKKDPSQIISVLIGTKDGIHKWLRMSGPARCALWIERTSLACQDERHDSSATLELVYRQRDFQVIHIPILQECKIILSIARQSESKKDITSEINNDDPDFDWSGLRHRDTKQMSDENTKNDTGWQSLAPTTRWYILMKVSTFKKLHNMLSCGGALWEFRRLLLQVINLPEFLDIDFRNVDLQKHLIHHPYAIFLFRCDAIMTRTTSKGLLIWKIVRFDFDQGKVTLAGGETLKGLMCCVDNNVYEKSKDEIYHPKEDIQHNKHLHKIIHDACEHENPKCYTLRWAVWRGVYQVGPLETMLTSAFVDEDDYMILKSLTTFFTTWKDKELCQSCETLDSGTSFRGRVILNSTWKLSSKERCALLHLQSTNQELRQQGLRTLLNLLLVVGNQTERALKATQINLNGFEEMKSEKSSIIGEKICAKSQHGLQWQQLLEWVDNGFLKVLLKEGIGTILKDSQSVFILVEDLANACLQVISIIPGEGTRQIVDFFLLRLQYLIEVLATLKIDTPQQEVPRVKRMEKLRIPFEEMVYFCQLLAHVVSSSVSAASSLANMDGLVLIISLYSKIAKEFHVDVSNLNLFKSNIGLTLVPGEVFGLDKHSSKVSKLIGPRGSCLQGKSSKKLHLQKVSISSRISHAFFAIYSKVSNVILEDNIRSNTLKLQFGSHIPRLKARISSEFVIANYPYPTQWSSTIVDIMSKAKYYLLQSLVAMLESQSIILNKCKKKLFVEITSSNFLSWCTLDLIGGSSNAFPPYIGDKLNKNIFKLIYLLDKEPNQNKSYVKHPSLETPSSAQYVKETNWYWSGPGPPLLQPPQIKLSGIVLVELKESMDYIINCLMTNLRRHVFQDGRVLAKYGEGYTKEYISSLWIDLACLFMVLSDYIKHWPSKEAKSCDVLECCVGHFNQSLTLFANLGPAASWTPAQILAMHNLIILLGLCIQDLTNINENNDYWSKFENLLCEMLVDMWAHWNCIQSYVSWLVLEVCWGCLIHLLDEFQRSLLKPIRSYYSTFGEQLGMRRNFDNTKFIHCEFLPIKGLMFLQLVVILVQRKIHINDDGGAYLCFRDNAFWFLQEIMNPSRGLLMIIIKNGPLVTCRECEKKLTNPSLGLESCSSIKQHSLILLAQIFSLRLSCSNIHVLKKYSRGCKNIFLSKKYLIPFLDTLYSSFKNLYSKEIQQAGLNSLQEIQFFDDGKKHPQVEHCLESSVQNDKDLCSARDETLSLCYSYAHVLLAVAKNLSVDGNQAFKDLCVVDFLVQEISLEYEYSQIASPRSNFKDDMTTSSMYTNSKRLSTRKDLEIFKGLKGSNSSPNSSSNSIRNGCALSSGVQDYGFKNSTLQCQDFILQWTKEKNISDVHRSTFSSERDKVSSKTNKKLRNDSIECNKKMFSKPNNHSNFFGDINDSNNLPLHLSGNHKYETMSFASKLDHDDFTTLKGSKYYEKIVVYSGRFFDLNEEVEREFVAEGDHEENDNEKQNLTRNSKVMSNETQVQYKNVEDVLTSSTSSRSTPCESTNKGLSTTSNARPLIPKLNFTSALKKIQSSMGIGFDIETIQNDMGDNILNNEDINNGCKSSNLYLSYDKERSRRPIYHSADLHVLLLELLINLMLNPQGTLEICYCDRFPMEHRKVNAPFYLFYHLNHLSNEDIMPILAKKLETFHLSTYMILKLTWKVLFDPLNYINRSQIAQGASSRVYTATKKEGKDGVTNNEVVVLKVVDMPKGPHEPCSFFDVYSEVQILHRFRGDPRVCQILDYGVDRDAFVLVLKHYKCSLRAWRKQHTDTKPAPLRERLPLYLQVYAAVLEAVKALEVQNVVHYDLKCDNVLLEPLECTVSEDDFWWPSLDSDCPIPFRVSITDFGQSKASFIKGGECTARNRGTECVKSPEMLKSLSCADALHASTSSLEDEISVGKAGDVWGLGCLLYELLTGEYLLYDDDWVRFFMRVTLATEELIPDEKAAKLDNYAPMIDFLRFILVRDPNTRPSLDELTVRLKQQQALLKRECQLHKSAGHDFFEEVSDMAEDDEPQNEIPHATNARQFKQKNNAQSQKRCQTPSLKRFQSKRRVQIEIARGGKRLPKFLRLWRLCCSCCWRRDVDTVR